jgi:type I restriction enzyme S subunit
MNEGWVDYKFKDVATAVKGKLPKSKNEDGIGIPYLTASYLRSSKPDFWIENLEGAVTAEDGDCLILWDGAGAGDLFSAHRGVVSSTMAVVTTQNSKILREFLTLFISSKAEYIKETCRGTTVPHVSPDAIANMDLKIPPIPVQKRIVDLISSLDSYIQRLEGFTRTVESIRSSISESLWQSFRIRSKLSSFGETLTGSTPPTKEQHYWESHDVDFFTPSDLGASLKLNTAGRGVSSQGAAISRLLKGYSVLQVCIGATIGKVGFLNHPAVMNQQINAITNLTEHDAPVLAAILSSETFQSIIRNTAGGSTLPIISKSSWGQIEIPYVPEIERIQISKIILELDSFIQQSKESRLSAKKLRISILQNQLNGTHEIPTIYDEVMGAAL